MLKFEVFTETFLLENFPNCSFETSIIIQSVFNELKLFNGLAFSFIFFKSIFQEILLSMFYWNCIQVCSEHHYPILSIV